MQAASAVCQNRSFGDRSLWRAGQVPGETPDQGQVLDRKHLCLPDSQRLLCKGPVFRVSGRKNER